MELSEKDKKALAGIGIALFAAYAEQSLRNAEAKEMNEWKKLGYSIGKEIAKDAKSRPTAYYDEGVKIYTEMSKRKKKRR